jgi:hypothetical protein
MRLAHHFLSIPSLALALIVLPPLPARGGQVLLDFTDIPIPGGTDSAPFFTYSAKGFTLTAINPPSGLLSGFEAHGPNSIFFMGKIGVFAFAPTTSPPDNAITLTQDNGQPFSLLSIDLARNFLFDPAPTVTFTGTQAGGGTVTESFTVTTLVGVSAFQAFHFTGFTNLVSVTWGQPELAGGLHQFTDILLQTGAVPEPSTLILLALGVPLVLAYTSRARRRGEASRVPPR